MTSPCILNSHVAEEVESQFFEQHPIDSNMFANLSAHVVLETVDAPTKGPKSRNVTYPLTFRLTTFQMRLVTKVFIVIQT